MCECSISDPSSNPGNPNANPTSWLPSNAPTQMLPASLVATAMVIGNASTSDTPQTSFSTASAFLRSSKLVSSRMEISGLGLDSVMGSNEAVQYTGGKVQSATQVSAILG